MKGEEFTEFLRRKIRGTPRSVSEHPTTESENVTPIEKILRMADDLEALTREESLRDIDYTRQEWSAAGLRELARLRSELESRQADA